MKIWGNMINNSVTSDDFSQLGISPHSFDHFALERVEFTNSLDFILMKISFKNLSIGQLYLSSALFAIFGEHAFIVFPVVFKVVEVGVVEWSN